MSRWMLADKYGFPVELIKGRPVTNFFRRLIHTRKIVCRRCFDCNLSNYKAVGKGISRMLAEREADDE